MAANLKLFSGEGPLMVTIPHAGMAIPEDLRENYTGTGLAGVDADAFVDKLYSFTQGEGITTLTANLSRYVIDLNRSPRDEELYPGQFSTGLLTTVSFDKKPLYIEGCEPDVAERARRIRAFYTPYHREIERALAEKKLTHGRALLWDAHSIASRVPSLFEGKLPDFNFGTFDGKSCGLPVEAAFGKIMKEKFPDYSFVFNGRFKGGFTTRHYGRPSENVHAVQLELSKATYMNEGAGTFDPEKAARVKGVLSRLLLAYRTLA